MSLAALLMPLCLVGADPACGLVDAHGRWAVAPRFAEIAMNGHGFTAGTRHRRVELLDAAGKPVGDARWREVGTFSEGLAPATSAEPPHLEGYIDTAGRWVIEPRFKQARAFRDGMAVVMLDSSGGNTVHLRYIRRDGSFAFAQTFRSAHGFEGGLAAASIDDEAGEGVLDLRGRWVVVPQPGQTVRIRERGVAELEADPKGETLAVVVTPQGQTLVDRLGRRLVSARGPDGDIRPAGEGRAFVNPADEDHMGMVDTGTARMLLEPQANWHSNGPFVQGLALAHASDGGAGFVDRQGRWVLEPRWGYAHPFDRGLAVAVDKTRTPEGHAPAGLIDRRGRWVLEPVWLFVRSRQEGAVNGQLQLPAGVFEATPLARGPAAERPTSAAQALEAAAASPTTWRPVRTFFRQHGDAVVAFASMREHPCGFEVLIDEAGVPQGLDDVQGRCLLAAQLDDAAVAALPDDVRRTWRAARRAESLRRAAQLREDSASGGGAIAEIRAEAVRRVLPELARREARAAELVRDAGWVTGPAEVVIDEATGVTYVVPEDTRLLPPAQGRRLRDALRALRDEPMAEPAALKRLDADLAAGRITADAHRKQHDAISSLLPAKAASAPLTEEDRVFARQLDEMSFGLLEPSHRGWRATVSVPFTGAVDLRMPGDPAELLERLQTYQTFRGVEFLPKVDASTYTSYRWVIEPRLDRASSHVDFAFSHRGLLERGMVYNSTSFGRTHAAVIQASVSGLSADDLTEAYLDDFRELHKGVRFPAGQRFEDIQGSDVKATLRIDELVTGPKPEALKRLGQAVKRVEDEHDAKVQRALMRAVIVALGLALLLGGAWARYRAKEAGHA